MSWKKALFLKKERLPSTRRYMKDFKVDKDIIVMGSEPSPDMTLEMAEKAARECVTESELATLFAIIENKAWRIEDEEYDYDEGTAEHRQAVEKTELWFALADKLRKRIFCILQSEGMEIPSTRQITVLEPFMKRNGYKNGQGWWVKDNMCFEINASGINIKLQINGYRPTNKENWDSEWCRCDFLFSSGDWLNYHKENDEVLLASEVEELEDKLSKLLDNKLTDIEEMVCIEPDFIFKLYPQTDLREDPKYTYVQPGYEIQDIYLEWKIFFWHGGLTDNHLTITLDREEIESLRDYLAAIIKR